MPAHGGDARRLHPRGPAAHDGHTQRLLAWRHMRVIRVTAGRVDGTGDLLLRHERFLPTAAQAGDAPADRLDLAVLGFERPIRIRQHLPREADQVGAALGQDLLAVFGVAQRVAVDDRDVDDLFDRLGRVHGPALVVVHRVEACARALLDAHAEIEGRDTGLFHHLRHQLAFFHLAAARHPLVDRVANHHGEVIAALLVDLIDDGEREAHPVFEAAAETIGAPIQQRAHELGQQIAVGRMQLDRIEAGLLDAPGRLGKEVDQLQNLLGRRRAHRLALFLGVLVDDLVAGRPGQLQHAVVGRQRIVARDGALPARVHQLDRAPGAVTVHAVGEPGQAGDEVVAVRHQAGHGGPAGLGIRRGRADDDQPDATFGELTVMIEVVLTHRTIGVRGADVGRHMDDAVGHLHVSDTDRGKQVGELAHRHVPFCAVASADVAMKMTGRVMTEIIPVVSRFANTSTRATGCVVQGLAWPARVQATPRAIDPLGAALICVCLRHLRLSETCQTADVADVAEG